MDVGTEQETEMTTTETKHWASGTTAFLLLWAVAWVVVAWQLPGWLT